jgi:phenylpyruvate tautomerase PptA (4-oxalocrotonate tautomerase family)
VSGNPAGIGAPGRHRAGDWRGRGSGVEAVVDRLGAVLGVVKELTEIVAEAAGDPSLPDRTWVLITESPEGGWGIGGHANTGADRVAAARAALAGG